MARKPKNSLEKIIYVSWEESEQGWGTRPDGCSLHLSLEQYRQFVKEYWEGMPKEVPYEYSRPAGTPAEAYVSKDVLKEIKESKNGLRLWEGEERRLIHDSELKYGMACNGWLIRERI